MMKKITTIILSIMMMIFASTSYACNFQISQFGDPKENLKLAGPQPISMPDQFGGENLLFPIIDVCKNDESFEGTMLIYLYIENKLSRIQLYRPNKQDTKLMDFAMSKYGKFNLPEGLPKLMWRGSYQWESGNDNIEYIRTDIHEGHAEIIDITSKLYSFGMQEYNAKVGEWLDSQQ
jgi:hypothetical protein